MTLRTRLALGLLALGLVLSIPLFATLRSLDTLDRSMAALQGEEFRASLLFGEMRKQLEDVRAAELSLNLAPDSAKVAVLDAEFRELSASVRSLRPIGLDTAARSIELAIQPIRRLSAAEFAALATEDRTKADLLSDSVRRAIERSEAMVGQGERSLRARTSRRVQQASTESRHTRNVAAAGLALAATLATVLSFWLVRSISRPVRDLERGMEAVAGGEFGYRLRIHPDRADEFGRLASSYHTMSSQLAALDKLKAEFVSVASHELKTPINVIGGYLQLLEEGVYGPLTPKQLEVLGTIAAQSDALARLVRQLLDVSRFEAGGGKIEPRRFALAPFLDDLERAFHVLALQRGVNFRVTRAEGLPEDVAWDADRINEVLGNMLSNSFKFTPRGGSVDLMAEPDESGVQLTVRDTGAGIPPTQLPHIFRKFYQADNQASAAAKGTGLGLAISKEIVGAHGGTIAVDSAVGIGTTFTIVLPEQVRFGRRTTPRRAVVGAGV